MKRAADLAEALYGMPRNNGINQLAMSPALQNPSVPPVSMAPFNSYTSQLSVPDPTNSQVGWGEGGGEFEPNPLALLFLHSEISSLDSRTFREKKNKTKSQSNFSDKKMTGLVFYSFIDTKYAPQNMLGN